MRSPEARSAVDGHFTTHDGASLFYRHWPAVGVARRGAIVMFHRGHEHSGRMAHLVEELDLPDFDFFAWDARGHGRSPGERGYSPSLADSVRDVDTFVRHIRRTYSFDMSELAVLAQSVGAVLAIAWAHDYAPDVRCLVAASPAFEVKLYVPLARPALALWQRLRGNFFVQSYVKSRFLTRDAARQAAYDADPLISRAISSNILLDLHATSQRLVADAQAIGIPTLLLISGQDWVVRQAPQHAFFERLGSAVKEKRVLDGFVHDTFGERDRQAAIAPTRQFILDRFAEAPSRVDRRDADRRGMVYDEAAALARPLPRYSPRGLFWGLTRLGIRFGALFSDGLRIGQASGFDSGASLDYVYRNVAGGRGPLGRLIDRVYLDNVG